MSSYQKRSKDELAKRVAQDIHDGAYVNLGIGQPTLVANHIPAGLEVILQSENGILGMGPAPAAGLEDYDLINAGKQPVTLLPGGAYFHHADSFAMMRGGHLDICVLGAFQVSATGDLANWSTGEPGAIPAVGGAMDLAIGAKQTWVMMDLLTKQGAQQDRGALQLPAHRCRLREAHLHRSAPHSPARRRACSSSTWWLACRTPNSSNWWACPSRAAVDDISFVITPRPFGLSLSKPGHCASSPSTSSGRTVG